MHVLAPQILDCCHKNVTNPQIRSKGGGRENPTRVEVQYVSKLSLKKNCDVNFQLFCFCTVLTFSFYKWKLSCCNIDQFYDMFGQRSIFLCDICWHTNPDAKEARRPIQTQHPSLMKTPTHTILMGMSPGGSSYKRKFSFLVILVCMDFFFLISVEEIDTDMVHGAKWRRIISWHSTLLCFLHFSPLISVKACIGC